MAFIGEHHRGPSNLVEVNSWSEFVTKFGGFPPVGLTLTNRELAFSVFQWFNNGGGQCFVARVPGTTAVAAFVVLSDRAGSPLPTLRVEALNTGIWGNNLRVDVVDRAPDRFDLIIKDGGTTDAFVAERWLDLSMDPTDPRYVLSVLNSVLAGSVYVVVTSLASGSAAPTNRPAIVTGTTLSGGTQVAPTSTAITNALTAGLSPLDTVPGVLMLNLPGNSTVANVNAALLYAQNRGDVFVLIDPTVGLTPAQVQAEAATYTSTSFGAVYYPWVQAIDPTSTSGNATRLTAPGGFVGGVIARTDSARGVHKAPAGLQSRLNNAVALERKLSDIDLDNLNVSHVNAIRDMPGAGIVVMGSRTLKLTQSDKYVPVRRTLNYVKSALTEGTQWAIFEPNDEYLWATLQTFVTQFLLALWQSGGLKGATASDAFYVKCDGELNTPQVIAAGEVRVEVGVALQHPAEFVVIRVGQWDGGSSAQEIG